ncbi:SCO family protein, partial [Micrococcus luteus]|nr:SCO family protein [Micrococcus luteus]
MRFVAYFLPLLISLSVAFSLLAMRPVAAQWQHLFNLTHSDFNGSSIRGSHFGRGLEARDEHGNDFKFDDFKGKLSLVYFGFTHCPDVCPNTLVQIQQALNLLAPIEAEAVQFYFVTVDPARDTPQRLREYLS